MKNGHNKWQQQGMYNCIYLCTATKVYARKSVRRRLASRLKRLGGKAVACRLASPYRFKNIAEEPPSPPLLTLPPPQPQLQSSAASSHLLPGPSPWPLPLFPACGRRPPTPQAASCNHLLSMAAAGHLLPMDAARPSTVASRWSLPPPNRAPTAAPTGPTQGQGWERVRSSRAEPDGATIS